MCRLDSWQPGCVAQLAVLTALAEPVAHFPHQSSARAHSLQQCKALAQLHEFVAVRRGVNGTESNRQPKPLFVYTLPVALT